TFFEALENPGEEYRIELRGKTEDGWKWFEGRAINYLEKPEIEGVIVTGQTIDERKKAEEELNKWSKAMKASMDGMAILDENEEYIYLNNAHAEIYGYDDTDELLGKTWGVLYDDEEIKRFEDEIMPTFREKGRWKGEAIGKKKDGTKFPQELSLTALEDGGLICVVRDITERKEAERQTEESKEKIEKLHQISANLETCQSEDEIYSYAIEAAKEILEFDMCSIKVVEGGLIVNKKASNDYPEDPEPLPVEDSIAGKAFLEKESFLNSDIHQEAEASPTLDIYRSGITVPIGKFAIFQAVSTEVDYFDEEDLKIAELLMDHVKEALKRVETEEREEFLHSLLRHDVKNKTQLVKGYLKLLEEDVDLPDEAKNYIQKAKKVTKVSDEIIEKVRKLKQIKQEDEIGEIEIDSVLDQILSEHKDQAEKEGIDIEVQTSECKVKGGTLLQEMISNLAENSIIHSDCDKIRIKDECEGNECVVTVEDDGKGIPDDVKEKIFERGYKQGENAGSGLGMYLVKEIVESYGGSVEVKDSEFGGAGFEIHLQRIR
ncbi:MAG: ATP-binding protein, partial [Thermoplasmatota archaeon]